jgi:hypothetical protein
MGSTLVEKWGASLCRKMGSIIMSKNGELFIFTAFWFSHEHGWIIFGCALSYPLVANPRGVKESERIGRREIVKESERIGRREIVVTYA